MTAIHLSIYGYALIACTLDSTLGPKCVDNTKQAVVYYFDSAVRLFQTLPTYKWLAAAGISPSKSARYTHKQIVDALKVSYGFIVGLECKSGSLDQVNYYHNVSLYRLAYPILSSGPRLI
jgi:ribonuclease T2